MDNSGSSYNQKGSGKHLQAGESAGKPRKESGTVSVGSSNTRYFAVFGNPVLHSRSPQIYNSLFSADGTDAFYTRILTGTGEAVCEIIRHLDLAGGNITTPFKEEVLPYMDKLSPEAEMISAVNTILNLDGLLTGYNTDADGITGALLEAGIDPQGKKCMVMGAGGAGKAAVAGLLRRGAEVLLANRSIEKAAEFAAKAGCNYAPADEASKMIKDYDILVLTLPPGVFPFRPEQLHPDLVIADANYRSPSSGAEDTKLPCRVIRGDRWLLHQAVEAYRLFSGYKADTTIMDRGMNEPLNPEELLIKIIDKDHGNLQDNPDMLVDGRGMSECRINQLIDEEKSRAFGHKG